MVDKNNRAWFLEEHYVKGLRTSIQVVFDENKSNIDRVCFNSAKPLKLNSNSVASFNIELNSYAKKKPIEQIYEYIYSWDNIPNSTGAILANTKLQKILLEIAHDDIQVIPAEILMPDGKIIDDYKFVHIIKRSSLLNKEKSVLLPPEEQEEWQLYEKYYFNKDCLVGLNLARANETSAWFASDKVKQACEKAKIKGLEFESERSGNKFIV